MSELSGKTLRTSQARPLKSRAARLAPTSSNPFAPPCVELTPSIVADLASPRTLRRYGYQKYSLPWYRLWMLYNVGWTLFVLAVGLPDFAMITAGQDQPLSLAIALVFCFGGANLAFALGPIVDEYLVSHGRRRSLVPPILLGGGMLFSGLMTAGVLRDILYRVASQ